MSEINCKQIAWDLNRTPSLVEELSNRHLEQMIQYYKDAINKIKSNDFTLGKKETALLHEGEDVAHIRTKIEKLQFERQQVESDLDRVQTEYLERKREQRDKEQERKIAMTLSSPFAIYFTCDSNRSEAVIKYLRLTLPKLGAPSTVYLLYALHGLDLTVDFNHLRKTDAKPLHENLQELGFRHTKKAILNAFDRKNPDTPHGIAEINKYTSQVKNWLDS